MITINNRDEDSLWTRAAIAHLDFGALEASRQADILLEGYRARRAEMLAAESGRSLPRAKGPVMHGC